ncbi:hypothetical protein [Nocardioides campestrisoli]|uniref:hypothetical protein n=1 Tax=Nocardioides campestrisoli TaxID=2736757 RepID=UPI00163DB39E|nr:hypothetical protein [Nocardioides campestrisoli]
MKKPALIVFVIVVVLAVAGLIIAAVQLEDETVVSGDCSDNTYDLSLDGEDGGVQVDFSLQTPDSGQTWQVVVQQDSAVVFEGSRATDDEGELEVELTADKDAGNDFTVVALSPDGTECRVEATHD